MALPLLPKHLFEIKTLLSRKSRKEKQSLPLPLNILSNLIKEFPQKSLFFFTSPGGSLILLIISMLQTENKYTHGCCTFTATPTVAGAAFSAAAAAAAAFRVPPGFHNIIKLYGGCRLKRGRALSGR